MSTTYHPIACSLHDEFESAITLKKVLHIEWFDEQNVLQRNTVIANDLIVRDKQEFLVFKVVDVETKSAQESTLGKGAITTDNNTEYCIRLDRITLLENN